MRHRWDLQVVGTALAAWLAVAGTAVTVAPRAGGAGPAADDGQGYWLVERSGAVSAFGAARALGAPDRATLNQPGVCLASSPSGDGDWLVAGGGGILADAAAP